jgi:K(+)-stimulated pyrophosphate-energized sodium pump
MAFLKKEYQTLIPFVLIVAILLFLANMSRSLEWTSASFLLGAITSAVAGYVGMKVATAANSRTTHAAQKGIAPALKVSFAGGTVMGMSVVGLAMGGILLVIFTSSWGQTEFVPLLVEKLDTETIPLLSSFSLGASSIALFARVGGGIFTKAADVGADLVGKVEAGIPEDDHRNPAVIADNVGDNVGDVAGMGADLFESFVGSLVGAMILGLAAGGAEAEVNLLLAIVPLILVGIGVISSLIGIFFVRGKKGKSPQGALNFGTFGAAVLSAVGIFLFVWFFLKDISFGEGFSGFSVFWTAVIGLGAGTAIGLITEFFTGVNTPPVNTIVKNCDTGAATTIISGMGMGMMSAFPPIILITSAILGSYVLAGFYGIAIAALGMLVTLGIQLAVDAYGPIADNAGGLAEMAEFPPEVREVTDNLDAVGNTTAAIGKGFAIGSAALTALILFAAVKENLPAALKETLDLNITDPWVLAGLLLGAVIPYLFSSMAMNSIGKAAYAMIEEVRRQFREKPEILTEEEEPDYAKCVSISTTSAIREMLIPGIVAAGTPVLVGFLGGAQMLLGLLVGVTASGVVLAIFMSNAGGAWDNAKKMIETRETGGKGSEAHKAAVVGDTVGDPFKDTAGPSLNILIKLMAVVSLVIAPMLTK